MRDGTNGPGETIKTSLEKLAARYRNFAVEDLREDPPPIVWIWENWLPLGKAAVITGKGGGGKSAFCLGLAVARASGEEYLGIRALGGPTVIVSTEDTFDDYRRKIAAVLAVETSVDREDVARDVHVFDLSGSGFTMVDALYGSVQVSPGVGDLATVIRANAPGADLIVLETANRLVGGAESDERLSMLATASEQLALATGAAVLIVSHVSKQVARERIVDAYAPRGSGALPDNARAVLVLSELDDDTRERFGLTEEQAAGLLLLSLPKRNYAPPQEPLLLEPVGTRWGLVLRRAHRLEASSVDPLEARRLRGARLRRVVLDLQKSGTKVTARKLRDYGDRTGIVDAKNRTDRAVTEALEDGFLVGIGTGPGGGQLLGPGKVVDVARSSSGP